MEKVTGSSPVLPTIFIERQDCFVITGPAAAPARPTNVGQALWLRVTRNYKTILPTLKRRWAIQDSNQIY